MPPRGTADMDFFGTWILPPLAGAVIGYFTNWLAIKMLFRPFRELRFLGLRVPFTPGLLPRERGRIARSIGGTVASELLTEEVVRRRLGEPDIRQALVAGVSGLLDEALASRAASLLPTKVEIPGPVSRILRGAWQGLVSSEAFRRGLEEASRRALLEAEGLPLSRFLPPDKAGELAALLLAPANVESLRARLGSWVDEAYGRDSTGAVEGPPRLLPPEALEPVVTALAEGLYRAALPVLESFLREEEVKAVVGRHANEVVRKAVGRLNLFQRLIVGAAQYERRIAEQMPETVEDMSAAVMATLRGPGMAERAARAAAAAFRKASSEPLLSSLSRLVSRESARAALDAAVDALAESGPAAAGRAAAWASARSDLNLASLARSIGLPSDEIAARAALAASRVLSGAEGGEEASRLLSAALAAFLDGLGEGLGDRSLAQAAGIDERGRTELADWLAGKVLELVTREAGRIVSGLDVGRIVVERIDELDMAEIERIVLEVSGKELYWITLLGGILGGAIGVVQSVILRLWR